MIKLFIGGKGSGKTKALIELVNRAAAETQGSVVCIEKGDKLKLDVTYKARLIDTDMYAISTGEELYGFIAGILSSNNDITDIFVDSALKICGNDTLDFEKILRKLQGPSETVRIVMTASIPVDECPAAIKAYV